MLKMEMAILKVFVGAARKRQDTSARFVQVVLATVDKSNSNEQDFHGACL